MRWAGRRAPLTYSRRPPVDGLTQRLERCAHLRREERRFFPCGKVSASIDFFEVAEAGVHRLDPAARGGPDLAGKRGEADGNLDRRRSSSAVGGQKLSQLPVPPGGRSAGARQPVQG